MQTALCSLDNFDCYNPRDTDKLIQSTSIGSIGLQFHQNYAVFSSRRKKFRFLAIFSSTWTFSQSRGQGHFGFLSTVRSPNNNFRENGVFIPEIVNLEPRVILAPCQRNSYQMMTSGGIDSFNYFDWLIGKQ